MTKRGPLPQLDAAFTVGAARDAGASRSRMRAADLTAPFYGLRSVTRAEDVVAQARLYLPKLGAGQFFSHSTAAAIYGIPLPRRLEQVGDIHVSARGTRPRGEGVRGHRAATTAIRMHDDLPVTHPDWLLTELSAQLSLDDLIVAGDALVRRKGFETDVQSLNRAAGAAHGRGVRMVRAALTEVRGGTDSPMETRTRLLIVRGGLPEPVIHFEIHDAAGDFIGTPDLAYPVERIAIEYEGIHHREDAAVFADDIERRERMQEAGWYVIRVISDHIFVSPVWFVDRVRRVLAQRAR